MTITTEIKFCPFCGMEIPPVQVELKPESDFHKLFIECAPDARSRFENHG